MNRTSERGAGLCRAPRFRFWLGMVALAVATVSLAGCGSSSVAHTSPATHDSPKTELVIEYWPHGEGADGRRVWTLGCQPTSGDHPAAAASCAELNRFKAPFAPTAQPCPLVIVRGSPEAHVSGRFRDKPVSAVVRPGCGTRWQRLRLVLTGS